MSRQKIIIGFAALVGMLVWYLLLTCLPIMECNDGCSCGYQRTWYEMPDSLWHGKRLFMRIDKPGQPEHHHVLWDAQWGVWCDLPCRK